MKDVMTLAHRQYRKNNPRSRARATVGEVSREPRPSARRARLLPAREDVGAHYRGTRSDREGSSGDAVAARSADGGVAPCVLGGAAACAQSHRGGLRWSATLVRGRREHGRRRLQS